MKKKLIKYIIISLFINSMVYSQSKALLDNIYIHSEEYNLNEIEDAKVQGFKFQNATFNYDLQFRPTNRLDSYIRYHNNKENSKKKIKKVVRLKKYGYSKNKQFDFSILFNNEGLPTIMNQNGYIESHFNYDAEKRLIQRIRIINNKDTLFIKKFKYNSKSQITEYDFHFFKKNKTSSKSKYFVDYDSLNRPITLKLINSDGKIKIHKTVKYDNNKVLVSIYSNNKLITIQEHIYSYKYNQIKKKFSDYVVFKSYEKNNCIKKVTFFNGNFSKVRNYTYNKYDAGIESTYSTPQSKDIEINKTLYEYDKFGNLIYSFSNSSSTKNTYEFFYKIEYNN